MVYELLKGVGYWSEQHSQYVFTPKSFQAYMANIKARQQNHYDEYYQEMLVKGLAEISNNGFVTKEQLKKFLEDHKFQIGEQDINTIVRVIHQQDKSKEMKEEDLINEPIPYQAIKNLIN